MYSRTGSRKRKQNRRGGRGALAIGVTSGLLCLLLPADNAFAGSVCGDGTCHPSEESCAICPDDCCPDGDSTCETGEPADHIDCSCDPDPAAGVCDGNETCENCNDCITGCGDGCCLGTETESNCPVDCTVPGPGASDFATCQETSATCTDDANDCCTKSFTAGSIIIPMDRCHQQLQQSGIYAPKTDSSDGVSEKENSPVWCGDWIGSADNGMFEAYGLVYRLMQNGIPVYWLVNSSKDVPALTADQNLKDQTYTDRDVDFWVLNSSASNPPPVGTALTSCTGLCSPPVLHLSSSLSGQIGTYNWDEFPVRGSAFVIAPEDRTEFDALWNDWQASGDDLYDFSDVDMYEVQTGAKLVYQNFDGAFGATGYPTVTGGPVAATIDYPAPRLARNSPAGVSAIWLGLAKLDDPAAYPDCLTGTFSPTTAVYCDLTEDDFEAGHLINGEFTWAWIDNWSDPDPCGDMSKTTHMENFEHFLTQVPGIREAGHIMFMDSAVGVVEECNDVYGVGHQLQGVVGTGLATSGNPVSEPMILRYPANLYMQWGDLPTVFASGSVPAWYYYGGGATGYEPSHYAWSSGGSLVRLASEENCGDVQCTVGQPGNDLCTQHKSTTTCDDFDNISTADVMDCASYVRYEDDYRNGVVFYMGGNNVNGVHSHLRMLLNSLIATPAAPWVNPPPPVPTIESEVTRSGPIVTTIDGDIVQVQGTYDFEDPPPLLYTYSGSTSSNNFLFPYRTGHMRAVPVTSVGTDATDWASLDAVAILDASDAVGAGDMSDSIPPASAGGCGTEFTSSCRTVFTNTKPAAGDYPTRVPFSTAELATTLDASTGTTLQSALAPGMTTAEAQDLLGLVLAGRKDSGGNRYSALGGVDRSTVAVIGESPLIAVTRPKMIYFGALDGMLHAVCAELMGPCTSLGQELWAFIPRVQLPRLHENRQRIDGSPKVSDMLIDHDGIDTTAKQFRTVLTFQTAVGVAGFAGEQPAVYALDITDPTAPRILWELTAPETRSTYEVGVGLTLAMGPIENAQGELQHLTYVETNNGGAGHQGTVVTAVDSASGEIVWQWGMEYPAPRTGTNPPVPATIYPGGVAVIDMNKQGSNTHVLVGTLYGDFYLLNATDGTNAFAGPLFSFSEDFHPIGATPTVFEDATSGKLNVVLVSGGYGALEDYRSWAPAEVNGQPFSQWAVIFPLDPLPNGAYDENSADVRTIDLGISRGFAQAVVSGDQVFIITDTAEVNSADYGSLSGTGQLRQVSLSNPAQTIVNVPMAGGAGSADVNNGVVYTGSGSGAQQHTAEPIGDGATVATDWGGKPKVNRDLWLRIR